MGNPFIFICCNDLNFSTVAEFSNIKRCAPEEVITVRMLNYKKSLVQTRITVACFSFYLTLVTLIRSLVHQIILQRLDKCADNT